MRLKVERKGARIEASRHHRRAPARCEFPRSPDRGLIAEAEVTGLGAFASLHFRVPPLGVGVSLSLCGSCEKNSEALFVYKIIYSGFSKVPEIARKLLILLVGAGRFERPTPCAQGRCATRLRYAPTGEGSPSLPAHPS